MGKDREGKQQVKASKTTTEHWANVCNIYKFVRLSGSGKAR